MTGIAMAKDLMEKTPEISVARMQKTDKFQKTRRRLTSHVLKTGEKKNALLKELKDSGAFEA